MELVRLLKLLIPEIKVCRRKTGAWSVKTQSFCQENPKAGDINYGRYLMAMTRAETRLTMMLSPAYAIVTMLS